MTARTDNGAASNGRGTGAGALAPYRVLDLSDEQGMLCGRILGDLGADVIKIEPPGGDPERRRGPFFHDVPGPERSLFWLYYNASKRGITLNLETEDGRALLRRLIASADFLIESFTPGYLESLGLDYAALHALNHRLIVTSITPFGENATQSPFAATDMTMAAIGGRMYLDGQRDRPPVRIPSFQAYNHAGAQAAAGSLMAYYARLRTGQGQRVTVSIQESVVWTLQPAAITWDVSRRNAMRGLPGAAITQGRGAPQLWPCKDGHVIWNLAAGSIGAASTRRVVEMMAQAGMDADVADVDWEQVSYRDLPEDHRLRYEEAFRRFFRTKTKNELLKESRKGSIVPLRTTREVVESAQVAARGVLTGVEHDHLRAGVRFVGPWVQMSATQPSVRRRAPTLGEHNEDVYVGELGLSGDDLRRLAERGVI